MRKRNVALMGTLAPALGTSASTSAGVYDRTNRWIPILVFLAVVGALIPQSAERPPMSARATSLSPMDVSPHLWEVAAQGGLTLEARAGFDGYYKVNGWVPVQIVVANEGKDIDGKIQLAVQDGWRGEVIYTQQAILPTRSRKQFTLYVFVQNHTRELEVQLVEGRKVVAKQEVSVEPLADNDYLVGVVSNDASALNYLAGLPPIGNGRVRVAHLDLSDVPSQGRALTSVDVLILHDVDTSGMSDQQRDALTGWVALGGHLIICGGPNAIPTAAGLGNLLPVKVNGTQTTTDVGALGDFAKAPFIANVPAVVARVEPTSGWVMAGKTDLPLLIRRSLDRGRIDYLALDPNLEPMRTWIGNESLWPKLFFTLPLIKRSGSLSNQGNIGRALANIPSLDVPSVLLVMAFLFFYIVIVGPLNFLILKLVDKRALAWITLPVLILLFSCIAYVVGFASRGQKIIVSEISIVRAQPESGTAVIDSFVGLYSPVRRTYDVRLPDNVLVYRLTNSYSGPGGSARETLTVQLGSPTYLRQIEVDVGAMRNFSMHTTQPWRTLETNLTFDLSGSRYHVEGTISNQGNTDIQNCFLIWNHASIAIDDLPAGATNKIAVDFPSTTPTSNYQFINSLLGSTPTGSRERRERERKREILNSLFYYAPRGGSGQNPDLASELTLLGWMSESPTRVDVEKTPASASVTTLFIASLPVTPSDPNTFAIPKRAMTWLYKGVGPSVSPYELFNHNSAADFIFRFPPVRCDGLPPDAQDVIVERLFLHADALSSSPYGNPPTVYIRDVTDGNWEPFTTLKWGRNELPDPQRFIHEGTIEVRVASGSPSHLTGNTIDGPLSIDFTAVGSRSPSAKEIACGD